ncbi:type I-F CRISPR-associated protein Cas7f/Csy3 [Coxiella burnetii]|uniref:Hypothetical cytosolic protein n=1 Tax=Coxiella burnetii (strain Dugway 5J108-111) TaxID=434922 RepID=A9KCH5_COXBN|nr:type I-F CRISPR-associated protein Csy3 [Coxiella burnetii]ABS78227.1 hypothetical cytosolic protein [Coxiella burnetii Dugway 5J108-111]OYK80249.1 type I-F CRISPR-associated protein Cas7f/Csy3 [Coxiella burnetii]OYK82332.1 type I-F CRISPR-associated protein Cas7f/Csy3 [Coxiella burnetii]
MSDKNKKAASVLAFERKLDPSDAVFFAGKWEDLDKPDQWSPIRVREKAVRGTISNRLKVKEQNSGKINQKIEVPNLQRVDVAALPNDCDTLKVSFTLRILGEVGKPSACSSTDYLNKLLSVVEGYKITQGFSELAKRYAHNLANGRFLWRNRIGAEAIKIRVCQRENGAAKSTWEFDAFQFSLRDFEVKDNLEMFENLARLIESGLEGKQRSVLLAIEAFVRIGEGQEVFPSQELVLDNRKSKKKGEKGKLLYQINEIAAIHSQKIGNALRTIDTWYKADEQEEIGPIAVEPYGSVTTLSKACRPPKESDFYSLFDNWVLYNKTPEDIGNQHFVMATLIRGGVFGESSKEDSE